MQSLFTSEGQNPTRVCRIYNNRFILHLLIPVHFKVISTVESCEDKVFLFDQIINTRLDLLVPIRPRKIHPTEPPWISSTLKEMIQRRQRALYNDTIDDFRCLRNKVNRERKQCRAKYSKTKVEHLEHLHGSLKLKNSVAVPLRLTHVLILPSPYNTYLDLRIQPA